MYLRLPSDQSPRRAEWLANHPQCSHCLLRDTHDVGDWDNMVAACSHCSVLTCGACWDAFHADTCSLD